MNYTPKKLKTMMILGESRMKMFIILLLFLSISGCSTVPNIGISSQAPFCSAGKPIYWSKNDTDKTIGQVKEHNSVGKSICGWGGKKDTAKTQ